MVGKLLDFIILGTEKAGTTFIQEQLRSIPEVFMPPNEVRYFRDPFFGDVEKLHSEIKNLGDANLVGIKHPSYLGKPEVAKRIFEYNPNIKLIVSLRDPVERAVSSYFHYIRHGQIPLLTPDEGFNRMFQMHQENILSEEPKYQDILGFGFYSMHLERYYQFFSQEQILVIEYESITKEPMQIERIFNYLHINSKPRINEQINKGTYNWNACIIEHYKSKVFRRYDKLMNILEEDFNKLYTTQELLSMLDYIKNLINENVTNFRPSKKVIDGLINLYQEDVKKLREKGYLNPTNWMNFPI